MDKVPKVVNVRKTQLLRVYGPEVDSFAKWLDRPASVYVGRKVRYVDGTFDSAWGNYNRLPATGYIREVLTRRIHLFAKLADLEGKELGCWCVNPEEPDKYCHGHSIVALYKDHVVNKRSIGELRAEFHL